MGKSLRVLIVEDSEGDAQLVLRELRHGGYDPTFERVDTPETMAAALDKQTWDIVLTDHAMPQFSSFAALELLQKRGLDLPFIIVSGAIGEDKAVAAMKAGAHDYIMKDNLTRLVPAVGRELCEAEVRQEHRQMEEETRRFRETLRIALRRTIVALASAVEKNNSSTSDRGWRLADLARAIATEMGLSPEQIEGIRIAGLFHDIGNASVPAEILNKPYKIQKAELDIIKTHPQIGHELLKHIGLPWPIAQIVLQHHERMDGSGYP
ncbi:MAG: HD domain-containing phosphohydrolase, partial [Candidatus Brocadiales bacterium]